jgi:Tfp pilus assembly ATPase PilU
MQAGQKYGMQTMNQALFAAYVQRRISLQSALGHSSNLLELEQMIQKSDPEYRPQSVPLTSRK